MQSEIIEKMIKLRRQGQTHQQIARACYCSVDTVFAYLKKAGFSGKSWVNYAVSQDEINQMIELRKQGLTYSQIAQTLGRSLSVVNKHLAGKKLARPNSEAIQKAIELRLKGYTHLRIAIALDKDEKTIRRWLTAHGFTGKINATYSTPAMDAKFREADRSASR